MYTDLVFESDEVTLESALTEAMEFKLTFGKHKGASLKDLLVKKEGRSYLTWVLNASDAREYVKEYIKICMNFYQVRQSKPA